MNTILQMWRYNILSGWKPKINQNYFFINNQNLVGYRIYLETNTDNYHLNQLKLIEIGGYVNG
jgi:hypothetical protein